MKAFNPTVNYADSPSPMVYGATSAADIFLTGRFSLLIGVVRAISGSIPSIARLAHKSRFWLKRTHANTTFKNDPAI